MARTKRDSNPLLTICEIPDPLGERIEPVLLEDAPLPPKKHGGRPRIDWRAALGGILFRLRSGCPWNHLPRHFGDDSSMHRWFQGWCRHGIFPKIGAVLVEHCAELGAVDWKGQAADGMLGKARFEGKPLGPNPTDRAKPGTRKSRLEPRH